MPSILRFTVEGVDLTRAVLGCDNLVSWLYQGGDSPFKGPNGEIDFPRTYEVVKASVDQGITSLDLPPPLADIFKRLRRERREKIEGLGALQEWI